MAAWLHREWLGRWGLSVAEAEAAVRARLPRHRLPCAFVGLAGGRAVGTVSLVLDEVPVGAGRVCVLSGLFVHPARRGRGHGAALCRHAVAEARRRGQVPALYTAGQEAFYRGLGWTGAAPAVVDGFAGPELVSFMWRGGAARWRGQGGASRAVR